MGQVTRTDKVVDGLTYTTKSTYDGLGRVVNLTYPDLRVVTYIHNGPQLARISEGTSYASQVGFSA